MIALMGCSAVAAQAQNGYDTLSVRPVHSSDIMYKRTVIRAIDLRETQNKALYAKNRELSKYIVEAVKSGALTPYANDSLSRRMAMSEFLYNLSIPDANPPIDTLDMFNQFGDDWRSQVPPPMNNYYFASDLYQLEIKEEVLFDKQRSRMYNNIVAVTVYIPADHPSNIRGIQTVAASFSYKELCEKVFADNASTNWINEQNEEAHLNFKEAFELRLFSSYIIKVGNAKDAYLSDIYKDQYTGLLASHWAAAELMEYEHNMWEY